MNLHTDKQKKGHNTIVKALLKYIDIRYRPVRKNKMPVYLSKEKKIDR